MDKEKLKSYLTYIQTNIIENKTNQLILLGVGAFLIIMLCLAVLFYVSGFSKPPATEPLRISITPGVKTVKPTLFQKKQEKLKSVSWSINCQVVVTTSEKKRYLQKFKNCQQPLRYVLSPSGEYLLYTYKENNLTQMYLYSLVNNVEVLLDKPLTGLLDIKFTFENNLVALVDQKELFYYLVPVLYSQYPNNFDSATNTFTDVNKNKAVIDLPAFSSKYQLLKEENGKINLLDSNNKILYSLIIKDLNNLIIPQEKKNTKLSYDWRKRLIYYVDNQLKSVDYSGDNIENHSIICNDEKILPKNIHQQFLSRSPDGKILSFSLLSGEIMFFDLTKDFCENTNLTQSLDYYEKMSFSPNGQYLAFAKEGLHLYDVIKKQDNKILEYSKEDFSNSKAITGPILWSGDSKFLCLAVSKFQDDKITETKIVRTYLSSTRDNSEENVVTINSPQTPYACSPDGDKVLYINNNIINKYNITTKQNALFKSGVEIKGLTKLLWLWSGVIITDKWKSNESGQMVDLSLAPDFSVDESGKIVAFTKTDNIIELFDLTNNKPIENIFGEIKGKLLLFFQN